MSEEAKNGRNGGSEKKPRSAGSQILGALVIGALFGLVDAIIVMCYAMTPLYGMGMSTVCSLLTIGVIGFVLWYAGIYDKLQDFGGLGAVMPFSGFGSAIAGMTCGVTLESGSVGKAVKKALIELGLKVIVVATLVCIVVSLVMGATGFGVMNTIPYAPGGVAVDAAGAPVGIDPIVLLWGPVIGAGLSVIFQALLMLTKMSMGTFLTCVISLGGILTPFGVMKWLVVTGGGGAQLLIFGYGEAAVSTFGAMMNGMPIPFISLVLVFVFLFVVGIILGAIKAAGIKKKMPPRA